jgi:hypothetical protein
MTRAGVQHALGRALEVTAAWAWHHPKPAGITAAVLVLAVAWKIRKLRRRTAVSDQTPVTVTPGAMQAVVILAAVAIAVIVAVLRHHPAAAPAAAPRPRPTITHTTIVQHITVTHSAGSFWGWPLFAAIAAAVVISLAAWATRQITGRA